ncbi:hypothetical protein J3T65_06100 [Staphylococcus simiae]|uniref:hypothetical protein n=1 Tax=Staphylococcus simiae TaxID=308354 RepID=UPI001A963A73|nr:hypothetical protein [Staphylococcus simiae]MBO1199147.1 hypothetical protein [Staphylococcus simiae]MBO1201348.1 hypothetical protein [Staphylococcus simiae]MBO1203496.1 hypothetical protein [Staphylococcus simiae]MBO1211024.1 hypothetical protein [Staphylococcus simiae]MBO1229696.1 hypothetical protein [Staphylococcus simiae]
MKQFLYIALICGVISGLGVFLHMPQYPSMWVPRFVSIIGVISTILTFKDKNISSSLKFGGILINLLPMCGTFMTPA